MNDGDCEKAIALAERDLRSNRLSPAWKLKLAQMYGRNGFFEKAENLIVAVYDEDANIQDGFAAIGWTIDKETGDSQEAIALAERDLLANRLSLAGKWKLAQLYRLKGLFEKAEKLIAALYDEDANRKNGFATIGWTIYNETGDCQKAIALTERDLRANRLSIDWKLKLAQLYGQNGFFEKAKHLILAAYDEDAFIKDGFANVGWSLGADAAEWNTARQWILRDRMQGRLTGPWRQYYALATAIVESIDKAIELMDEAYAEVPSIKGGYTMLGYWGFLLGRGESFCRNLYQRDISLKRQYPNELFDRLFEAATGRGLSWESYLQYLKNPDWVTYIGFAHLESGNLELAERLMSAEYKQNSMRPKYWPTYTLLLNKLGRKSEAKAVMDRIKLTEYCSNYLVIGNIVKPKARVTVTELANLVAQDEVSWPFVYARS
ncbi:tetratricopeptide repeat protein [Thiorhodovibrio litoralis]|uniref:tetratricopeptide repeat protein n=1 Tax=Thiorhodovibrio litoralis TaxID=2952932 RepID=UPI002B25C234|nr:hypothetical protein [Thiorhodovibrio litoralis]WPL14184.1 hypothetical protein Thiosp_04017 [Thiorhodovibrio litoralis]